MANCIRSARKREGGVGVYVSYLRRLLMVADGAYSGTMVRQVAEPLQCNLTNGYRSYCTHFISRLRASLLV